MRNERGVVDYFLYFASNNRLGLSKMKEAMWKVDPGGNFTFSDATNPAQTVLFKHEPNRDHLRQLISNRFTNRHASVREIERFVIEETPFLVSHYKRVLARMEEAGDLQPVNPSVHRRQGTYPDLDLELEFH
ncbi:hypothetical protein ACIDI_27c00020 [Acidiphilium sp. JA12-A1]|nr:hypothetical protein ACIDI_27c00020 [Acidiphilium sp. JA12-A1]